MSEKTLERVAKVEALRKAGKTVQDACREMGISSDSYYKAKRRNGAITKSGKVRRPYTRRKITITELPTTPLTGKVCVFYGTPDQVSQLVGLL